MTQRQEFKQCLIKGWLTHRVWQCAAMIMIDHGIRHEHDSKIPDMDRIETFLRDIEVPQYPQMSVSIYIAAFYPMTSAALFINSMIALQTFWREKQSQPHPSQWKSYGRQHENAKDKQIKFIKLRELSKQYDWKTVK